MSRFRVSSSVNYKIYELKRRALYGRTPFSEDSELSGLLK